MNPKILKLKRSFDKIRKFKDKARKARKALNLGSLMSAPLMEHEAFTEYKRNFVELEKDLMSGNEEFSEEEKDVLSDILRPFEFM